MRVFKFLLCYLILFTSCASNQTKSNPFDNKEILLDENVRIVIPVSEERFSDILLYSHIEIWINSKKVYTDPGRLQVQRIKINESQKDRMM